VRDLDGEESLDPGRGRSEESELIAVRSMLFLGGMFDRVAYYKTHALRFIDTPALTSTTVNESSEFSLTVVAIRGLNRSLSLSVHSSRISE